MDTFPSSPPAAVRADLVALRAFLDQSGIPPKSLDRNLLIGTWNILGFGWALAPQSTWSVTRVKVASCDSKLTAYGVRANCVSSVVSVRLVMAP